MASKNSTPAPPEAPLTGVRTIFDVIRHLIHYGAPATDAIRAELVAAVDHADPDHDQAGDGPSGAQEPAEGTNKTGEDPA
jgi:hypothetical protein